MNAEKFLELALIAFKEKKVDKALWLLVQALKCNPLFSEAWLWRGHILSSMDDWFNALLHYEKAIDIEPNYPVGWTGAGFAFAQIAAWESAEKYFKKSLELMPAVEPNINLGNMCCHRMKLEEAVNYFKEVLKLDPNHHDAKVGLGLTLLGLGKWLEGWPYYYYRHDNKPFQPRARRWIQEWPGEDLSNKTIVLYPEQGLGDEIAFMRFAKVLANLNPTAKVILETRPSLVRTARTLASNVKVIADFDDFPEGIDYSCALMDVPKYLGIGFEDVDSKPYLHQPFEMSEHKDFRIGLCWSSGQRLLQPETFGVAQRKSIPLEWLKPLTQFGATLISLQREHLDYKVAKEMNIDSHHIDQIKDFADTADIIKDLDLVITVDTAVAHLAGAMGKPTWNFVRYSGYWPWMSETDKTCWYDCMKIYRQPQLENWDEPINRATKDLEVLVSKGKNSDIEF